MDAYVDEVIEQLEGILNRRFFRNPADLWLSYSPADGSVQPFVVMDGGNSDEVMIRHRDFDRAVGWMRAFVARTDGAKLDEATIELARQQACVPQAEVIELRAATA